MTDVDYARPDDETREDLLSIARTAKEGYIYRVYLSREGEIIETIPVLNIGPSAIQHEPTDGYLLELMRDPFLSYDELDRQIERARPGGDPTPPAAVAETETDEAETEPEDADADEEAADE